MDSDATESLSGSIVIGNRQSALVPDELQTPRLLLRRWSPTDAATLQPILAMNFAHLGPWIPRRVAEPAEVEQLTARLSEFSTAFDATREWRYALFTLDSSTLLGEVGLFPRNGSGRVPFDAADHVEIGYWLRADFTSKGFATEATRAALELALALPGVSHLTIRCDERNAPSSAVPRRLGFRLAETIDEASVVPGAAPVRLQIWEYEARQSNEQPTHI